MQLISDDPQTKEELANKSSTLEQNLQSVYVKSKGDVSTCVIYFCFLFLMYFVLQMPDVYSQSKSKLPKSRQPVPSSCFMVEEQENIPPGRYTLTQVTDCIADHYKDKNMYTAQVLADRINVDKKLMGTAIIHFQ